MQVLCFGEVGEVALCKSSVEKCPLQRARTEAKARKAAWPSLSHVSTDFFLANVSTSLIT